MKKIGILCVMLLSCFWLPMQGQGATEKVITVYEQNEFLLEGEEGQITYDMKLSGFPDYDLKGGVRWVEEDGETKADKPRGVHFESMDGSPTDKTLIFGIRKYAVGGVYYFIPRVNGVYDDKVHTLYVYTAPPEEDTKTLGARADETVRVRKIFEDKTLSGITLTMQTPEEDLQRVALCSAMAIDPEQAVLYRLQAQEKDGTQVDTLSEKVYVYLPCDENAKTAKAYEIVDGERFRRIGAYVDASEDTAQSVRIAVKELGTYLIVTQ